VKVAHISVPKSGSNILRNELGWSGKLRVPDGSPNRQRTILRQQLASGNGDVHGHLRYTEEYHELLKDHFIIFQYRDPRDTLVSWYHWFEKLKKDMSWKDIIHYGSRQMEIMEPWYEHCSLALRFEHLIEREYPPTHTFRKGKIGVYREEFPSELWGYYNRRCRSVKYWEYDE